MNKKETFPTLNPLHVYVQSVQCISGSFGTKSWWWLLLVINAKTASCRKSLTRHPIHHWQISYWLGQPDLTRAIFTKHSIWQWPKAGWLFSFFSQFPSTEWKKAIRIGRGQGDVRMGLGKEQMGKSEDTATWLTSCRENRFCTFPEQSQLECEGEK